MSPQHSFARKIYHLVGLVLLLAILSWLGRPSTGDVSAEAKEWASSGLFELPNLAQLRDRYGLSEARLGEIDPAGATIKLATLGLRGVAANILWEGQQLQNKEGLDQHVGDASADHPVGAALPQRVAIPGMEPVVQRVG